MMPESIRETLITEDGDVVLYRHFFSPGESGRWFNQLLTETPWRHDRIQIFSRSIPLPRLTAWYGDAGRTYVYSGIRMEPSPWTPTLLAIKSRIEPFAQVQFNSVLLNLYRNGQDSVAWHSDDEPELGQHPVIGSVSFGETRRFVFKHRAHRDQKPISIELPSGSLLLMRGDTQKNWLHQLPKTKKLVSARVNLTFRVIY